MRDTKVLVLMGGISTEREISLKSGEGVYKALVDAGYTVDKLDITCDNIDKIKEFDPDVAFLTLHGIGGEDGAIQGLLEWMKIPYTGPGISASAICMDKILTKKIMVQNGISTPEFCEFSCEDDGGFGSFAEQIENKLGYPTVVKSPCQGSSIGVEIVKNIVELKEAVNRIKQYGNKIFAEKFIDGVEVSVPVLGNDTLEFLPIIEILSENEFYDFHSKYTSGMSHHIIPARIDADVSKKIRKMAEEAYRATGCRGLSRIDFIIDKENNPYFIEINTSPGMTEMSLFPDSARHAGYEFSQLVDKIVKLALE